MPATEYVLKLAVQEALNVAVQNPQALVEALDGLPEVQLNEIGDLLQQYPPEVVDAFPAKPPTNAPFVVLIPGESEESNQPVGAEGFEYDTAEGFVGHTVQTTTFYTSTHHFAVYSPNFSLCFAVSKIVNWALIIIKQGIASQWGIVHCSVVEGGMDNATEWDTDLPILRRLVHITHTWPFSHTDRYVGAILTKVAIDIEDPEPVA